VIVLNGDIDPVVDMHGTEAAVLKIGFKPIEEQRRRPWFFNATATSVRCDAPDFSFRYCGADSDVVRCRLIFRRPRW